MTITTMCTAEQARRQAEEEKLNHDAVTVANNVKTSAAEDKDERMQQVTCR